MDKVFERFLKSLQIEDITPYEGVGFSCSFDKKNNVLEAKIYVNQKLNYLDYQRIFNGLSLPTYKVNLSFIHRNFYTVQDVYDLLKDNFVYNTGLSEAQMPSFSGGKQSITFIFNGALHYNYFSPVLAEWEEFLDDIDLDFEIKHEERSGDGVLKQRFEEMEKFLPVIKEKFRQLESRYGSYDSFDGGRYKVLGPCKEIMLKDLNADSGYVSFEGKNFYAEDRTTFKGKKMLTLYIYDRTDSVEVLVFENNRNFTPEKLELIKKAKHLKIKARVSLSDYNQRLQIVARSIAIIDEPFEKEILDTAKEKRVEFHVHTKMSVMDGVTSISDYIDQAAKWGHKAIAVTDHGVVQAFPEAQKAAKAAGIKMIYGSELYMYDEKLSYIMNPSDIELNKATYVSFDLETSGLSARYDKIIEFGAVKYKEGLIADRLDLLINPGFEISEKTTEITNITPIMLKGKPTIDKVINVIRDFCKDAILVSHNANFDVGFMNQNLVNLGYEELDNPVIDTLPLSQYLFAKNKFHNLGATARQCEVEYDEESAHRADYDAEVLTFVWIAMLGRLTKDNPKLRHRDLNDLYNPEMAKNLRPKHITCYARDAQGLKDLFKLISMSHIKYYAGGPRIPRSEIEKYREHLLIGSACFNGEVFDTASTRSKNIVKEKMKFYDFIEVQPIENYSYLINSGQIESEERVQTILTDIVEAADELDKMVIATSDCHYLHPYQKIFRDVYISAKPAKNSSLHPLNLIRRGKQHVENPSQHFRPTDEMLSDFAFLGEKKAKEIVVTNTNLLADSFEEIYPIKDKLYPPHIENVNEMLQDLVYKKAYEVYGDPLPSIVAERLEAELSGIIAHGYAVIYYIAHKIVQKAIQDGFLVGSRGSVGSSFVATMASITEVNALPPHYLCPKCKHSEFIDDTNIRSGYDLPEKECPHCHIEMKRDGQNIPFATFLGFNAEKVPDIDLNFSSEYQSQAHELTKTLLGEKNVYRAGTIETVAEKTAIGFALGYYESLGIDPSTISQAQKLYLAKGCENVKRTTGQHPGGIIVIPDDMDVYDFTAIQYPADDQNAAWQTTHFDFHAIHDNVLKLDLLGHDDPTQLKMLSDITGINPQEINATDSRVISLFSSREALNCHSNYLKETTGVLAVPEFKTKLTREMLKATNPKTFADLVIISGLSHGTDVWNGNAQDLINNGICDIHGVIGCRDDIMIYLTQHGINPSKAFKIMESVRKGKKINPDDEKMLREQGIPDYYIESCNKIKYLFPKAHAVAYVMMACRIAWYKVYYPLEFYASYFSTRAKQFDIGVMVGGEKAIIAKLCEYDERRNNGEKLSPKDDDIEKTLHVALEMAERGYKIEKINLNKSDSKVFIVDKENGTIIPPFSVIDGLGEQAAETVIEARKKNPFISVEDLSKRTKLNLQNIENLRKLGSLDDLPEDSQLSLF